MKKRLTIEIEVEKSNDPLWPLMAKVTVNGQKPLIYAENTSLVSHYKGALQFAQDQINQFVDVDVSEFVWERVFKEVER